MDEDAVMDVLEKLKILGKKKHLADLWKVQGETCVSWN